MKAFYLIFILFLVLSCAQNENAERILVSEAKKINNCSNNWSHFFTISDTILFNLSKEVFIGNISSIDVNQEYIAVLDQVGQQFYLFDHSGNFIRAIARKGSGPGEYSHPYKCFLTEDNKFIYTDLHMPGMTIFGDAGNIFRTRMVDNPEVYHVLNVINTQDDFYIVSHLTENNCKLSKLKSDLTISKTVVNTDISSVFHSRMFFGCNFFIKDNFIFSMNAIEPVLRKYDLINLDLVEKIIIDSDLYHSLPVNELIHLKEDLDSYIKIKKKMIRIKNHCLIKDNFILIEFMEKNNYYLSIIDLQWNVLGTKILFPYNEVTTYCVFEDMLYLVLNCKPDENGNLDNPYIVSFKFNM